MTIKHYRALQERIDFPWSCAACRNSEIEEYQPVIVENLSKEDLPDDAPYVLTRKGEMLIIHINCRSAVNKEEEIEMLIDHLKPDIICLTETWYDDSYPKNKVPDGYCIIRHDRSEEFKSKYKKHHGGGIAVLYKENLIVERRDNFSDKIEDIMWVYVKARKSFWLGTVYRPHYSDLINEDREESILEKNIRKVTEKSNHIILVGDLNIDIRDKENPESSTLRDICKPYGLKQYIKKTTRFNKNGKSTIIDHIWATKEADIVKSGTVHGISDHLGIYCKVNKYPIHKNPPIIKVRSFKNYNKEKFINDTTANLEKSQLLHHINKKDINAATNCLTKTINDTLEKHAPIKEIKIKKKRKGMPWINEELRELTAKKNQLLMDSYTHGFDKYRKRIRKINNVITCRRRNRKKKYIKDEVEAAGPDIKKLWKLLNLLTGGGKRSVDIEPDNMTQEPDGRNSGSLDPRSRGILLQILKNRGILGGK